MPALAIESLRSIRVPNMAEAEMLRGSGPGLRTDCLKHDVRERYRRKEGGKREEFIGSSLPYVRVLGLQSGEGD
jgi:hypothetical protein